MIVPGAASGGPLWGSKFSSQVVQSVMPAGTRQASGEMPYAAATSGGVGTTNTGTPGGSTLRIGSTRSAWMMIAWAPEFSKR